MVLMHVKCLVVELTLQHENKGNQYWKALLYSRLMWLNVDLPEWKELQLWKGLSKNFETSVK